MGGVRPLQPRPAGRRIGAQIAADIGRRQAQPAQAGDHDVGEVLADAAADLEGLAGRGRDSGGFAVIDELGVDSRHQVDRGLDDRAARREARPRIVGNGRRERRARRRIEKGRRAVGAERRRRKGRRADRLPGGAGRGVRRRSRVHIDPRHRLDDQDLVRLVDDQGQCLFAERAGALQAVRRLWGDGDGVFQQGLGGGGGRRQAQHAARIAHLRLVGVGGPVPHPVDHASAASLTVGTALAPCRK